MRNKLLLILPLLAATLLGCSNSPKDDGGDPINSGGHIDDGEYAKDEWTLPESGKLPIGQGNSLLTAPDNISNPVEISPNKVFDLSESAPNYFMHIMGNNKINVKEENDFYDSTSGGGFRFSKLYYGLQTCAFTSYKYLDISFRISAVEKNSKHADEQDEHIMHIYGYNKDGQPIVQKFIDQGAITMQTKGTNVNLSIHNNEVCYLEMRLSGCPYSGQQCYNFGIDKIELKGTN